MSTTVMSHSERVQDFLAQKRIAIFGLSRNKDSGAGAIYLKLRAHGYRVIPVHPDAEAFYGDVCYPTLSAIPGGVETIFIMNSPDVTEQIVDEAINAGVKRVWMHNNTLMGSSVSKAAVERCRDAGVSVIDVGCPMMFLEPDVFHSCMRWFIGVTGRMN